jgi:predicted XRE-type DNA-binding protein/predicted RNase H-like HicB family nuclease
MKRFEVKVAREGRWWMVEVPELDGLTQARRLNEVAQMAREWIALHEELSLSEVEVDIVGVDVDGLDVGEAGELVAQLRVEAKMIDDLIAHLTRETVMSLNAAQVPMRDISEVLGVSHQRVSQLVAAGFADATKGTASGSFAQGTPVTRHYPSADIAKRLELQMRAAQRLADEMTRMQARADMARRKAESAAGAAAREQAQARAALRASRASLETAKKAQRAADAARRALRTADAARRGKDS